MDDTEKSGKSKGGSPLRTQPPEVTRLNRNALLLVMALASVTVLVAVLSLQSTHGGRGGAGDSAATRARVEAQQPALPPMRASIPVDTPATTVARPAPSPIAFELTQRSASTSGGDGVSAVPPRTAHTERTEAYRRALARSPLIGDRVDQGASDGNAGSGRVSTGESPDADIERALMAPLLRGSGSSGAVAPNSGQAAMSTGDPFGVDGGMVQRAAREHREFLADARAVVPASLVSSVDDPRSPYELQAGVVIAAALVTEVNSDLPGTVVAQVSRDVFDSRTETMVLVPKGSRLVGRYDDRIVAGQSRVLVAWTRLLFPDGRSVALPGVAATDGRGATGVPGGVNSHLGRVFADAAVLSLLGAGAELSQPRTAGNAYAAPSVGQTIAAAAGTELTSVGTDMVRQGLAMKPTIVVPAGASVNVLLADDLVFPGAYVDTRE